MSKLRGQHFLSDARVAQKIVAAAAPAPGDVMLEVGPGLGVLTRELLPRAGRLVAVELDPLFVRELRREFAAAGRLEIVEGDILRADVAEYGFRDFGYKLVSNLPYNITSAFLKKFLLAPPRPRLMVVMVQKEVADRIVSHSPRAASREPTSMLGLMCNLYAECAMVGKVPPGAFAPPPKVDSAVIALKPYSAEAFEAKWGIKRDFAEDVLAFASVFFADPRKKMSGRLPKPAAEKLRAALAALGESPDSRPAVLPPEEWVALWKTVR